jgi:hypothetical protein
VSANTTAKNRHALHVREPESLPRISVVIPTYKRPDLLRRALVSALTAMLPSDEVIIVDDGSDENAFKGIADIRDDRIILTRIEHQGVSAARNAGMKTAQNDIIAFLDDDDEWHARKLDIQRELLSRHAEAVACFTNFSVSDASGSLFSKYLFQWGQPIRDWQSLLGDARVLSMCEPPMMMKYYVGDHYLNQLRGDYVLPSSLVIHRGRLKESLSFRVGMQRNESWLFSSQVCRQGVVIFVDEDLVCQHGDSPSRLTYVSRLSECVSKLEVLEDEYGRNTEFRKDHEKLFQSCLGSELKQLIKLGLLTKEADCKALFSKYMGHRAYLAWLAALPAPVLAGIGALLIRLRDH